VSAVSEQSSATAVVHGAVVQWCSGAVVQWCSGAAAFQIVYLEHGSVDVAHTVLLLHLIRERGHATYQQQRDGEPLLPSERLLERQLEEHCGDEDLDVPQHAHGRGVDVVKNHEHQVVVDHVNEARHSVEQELLAADLGQVLSHGRVIGLGKELFLPQVQEGTEDPLARLAQEVYCHEHDVHPLLVLDLPIDIVAAAAVAVSESTREIQSIDRAPLPRARQRCKGSCPRQSRQTPLRETP
jgi:hypothetical protein